MRWGVDPMAIAASSKQKDPETASGVTAVERVELPPVLDPQPAVQELANDSTLVSDKGGTDAQGDQTEKRSQRSKPHTTLLPHIALYRLMKSSRAGVCIILTLLGGMVWVGQEAAIVLHLKRVWGLDPHGAGIAFIAAVIPTVFCEPGVLSLSRTMQPILTTWAVAGVISGWLGDKYGPALVCCATILLSLPWYGLVTIEASLAMFLTFFALEGEYKRNHYTCSHPLTTVDPLVFFASGSIPPTMLELSSASRTIEGVGCASHSP